MPIYEYACEACGHRFDKLVKIGADAPPCPECGSDQVKKRVSAPAFSLKGSGWYKDHYGLKKSSAASAESAPTSGSDSGGKKGDA